jgi:internalin A
MFNPVPLPDKSNASGKALMLIDGCAKRRETTLDLRRMGLKSLPHEIGILKWLKHLYLDENELVVLPESICNLINLVELTLSNNAITVLHWPITKLAKLEFLDLDGNSITYLSPEICKLISLRKLYISNNSIQNISPDIENFIALKQLDLSGNLLKEIPKQISKLNQLTLLNLSRNKISIVPSEIQFLVSLKKIHLSYNRINFLPKEIGYLSSLNQLNLSNNLLELLPNEIGNLHSLVHLDLSSNNLRELNFEICNLNQLKELFLKDNPLLAIPISLLGNNEKKLQNNIIRPSARPKDILNYYFSLKQATDYGLQRSVDEIKVMIVGRGGAGKTSLRRFLMNEPHNKKEKETQGIALDCFNLENSDRNITVRLWDFAGQEITHALHQFFLTDGCVYLLVLDPRSNTEMQDAENWLTLLQRYSGGAPVLIVLNRQDDRQGGYDVDRQILFERFPFIQSFTPTNFEKREGCDELLIKLCKTIDSLSETELPHLKVPLNWLEVINDCYGKSVPEKTSRGEKFLRWIGFNDELTSQLPVPHRLKMHEFREICAARGEKNSFKQESLARLLHKLGTVMHFVDEPRLRDTSVLNPHWVTDAVYRLLRYKDYPNSDGILTITDILSALPLENEDGVRFLLQLMERFEMCFPLDYQDNGNPPIKWLIPGALMDYQPSILSEYSKQIDSVRLRYVYDMLPEGVLPRFIVMTHLLSKDKPRWRNGVELQDGNAFALVKRGLKRNHIEITAYGPDDERLRILEIVQGTLECINIDLSGPKPFIELELAGLPGVYRAIADLEAAEFVGQQLAIKTPKGKSYIIEPTVQLNQTSVLQSRNDSRSPLDIFLSYSNRDKTTKSIFQDNLTVLIQKKFILPWRDDLVESEMLWNDQVVDYFGSSDVFIGLLTTAFLASGFINKINIKAVKESFLVQGRDIIFILILVDKISLQGLNLSEYKILRPAGKSVSEHSSRKAGFNIVQEDLEGILLKRQELKKQKVFSDTTHLRSTVIFEKEKSITYVVQGDYISGDKKMKTDSSINVVGNVINSQISQEMTNCSNMINNSHEDYKILLEQLKNQTNDLIKNLPKEMHESVVENLELAIKSVTKATPDRAWYSVSTAGLLEASKYVKDFTGNIAGTIAILGEMVWPAIGADVNEYKQINRLPKVMK